MTRAERQSPFPGKWSTDQGHSGPKSQENKITPIQSRMEKMAEDLSMDRKRAMVKERKERSICSMDNDDKEHREYL